MAEYKNGVNFMGITSVDTEDVTIDIPTGRAVFADPDKYQSDPKYKARVDKYVREGFHLVNEGSGGSGGMDYDIVIRRINSGDAELIMGDFNAVYNKLRNREPILGMFINSSDYYSSVITDLYPLTYITDMREDEIVMGFTRVLHNNTSIYTHQWNVTWDAPDTISTEFKTATINSVS